MASGALKLVECKPPYRCQASLRAANIVSLHELNGSGCRIAASIIDELTAHVGSSHCAPCLGHRLPAFGYEWGRSKTFASVVMIVDE
jgi:hypothetical protein